MRKRKIDLNIIRKGDIVRIVNPEFFDRCGYGLTKEILFNEVNEKYGKDVKELIRKVHEEETNTDFLLACDTILDSLCYLQLKKMNFGGPERKIFTKIIEGLRGKLGKVSFIRYVQTGTYVPGDRLFGEDGEDYDPPFLDKIAVHKILSIAFIYEYGCSYIGSYDIESIHVVKNLWEQQETIQDGEGNWIDNPSYRRKPDDN